MQPLWKTVLRFLKKLKIKLPYDSASPLLGFNPKKLKLDSPRDIFIPVFVVALFAITYTGKQPKCPLMYQWIDICYIRIMECCVCVCVCILSHSVVSDALRPHGLQLTRPPCPSLSPRVFSNSCPLNQWFHPTISPSVAPFSFCPQSFIPSVRVFSNEPAPRIRWPGHWTQIQHQSFQ